MDWATLQTGLIDWAGGLVTPVVVQWETQPMRVIRGPAALLNILAIAQLGWDETRYVYNGANDNLDTEHRGSRTITLSFKVRTLDQTLQNSARAIAENFRLKAGTESSREALRAIGLGFAGIGSFALNDFAHDGRLMSQGNVDVLLNAGASIVETATDYIESIAGTGTLQPGNRQIGYNVP